MISRRWTKRLVSIIAFAIAVSMLPASSSSGRPQVVRFPNWCGRSENIDWACRGVGQIRIGGRPIRSRTPRAVPWGSRIAVSGSGSARLRLGGQAICEMGGVVAPTEIVTHYESSLFQQETGASACTSVNRGKLKFGFFCNLSGSCPAQLWSNGTVLNEWSAPMQRRSVSVSVNGELEMEGPVRELISTICTGSYRVEVTHGNSSSTVAGSTSDRQVVTIRIVESGESNLALSAESDGENCGGRFPLRH